MSATVLIALLSLVAGQECFESASEQCQGPGVSLLQTMKVSKDRTILHMPEKDDVPPFFWGYRAKRADVSALLSIDSQVVKRNAGLQKNKMTNVIGTNIVNPSEEPYNLRNVRDSGYYAQWRQDEILQPILDQISDGFFVESGARDGEEHSNSLFYELHGWKGLLVEPSRVEYSRLVEKHRKAYLYNGCLSPTKNVEMLHFTDSADGLSHMDTGSGFVVQAQPLSALLHMINRTTIDFWSLDIEGSEASVLRNLDFDQIEVGVLLIEMNKSEENNKEISQVMLENGFKDVGKTHYNDGDGKQWLDHIFVNPKYFQRRGLKYPLNLVWKASDWSWSWDWGHP